MDHLSQRSDGVSVLYGSPLKGGCQRFAGACQRITVYSVSIQLQHLRSVIYKNLRYLSLKEVGGTHWSFSKNTCIGLWVTESLQSFYSALPHTAIWGKKTTKASILR